MCRQRPRFPAAHVPGVQWRRGAVGTGRFTGPRLRDLLQRAAVKSPGKHVMFRGLDEVPGNEIATRRAVEKTLRGKVRKQTFPPRLEIPQTARDSHFASASTATLASAGKTSKESRKAKTHYKALRIGIFLIGMFLGMRV
ncbi:MAG TPA: molybdopterin-dependent oxidoreductase [Nitrososphaera sp.]|nr:molybdopterin-dependent oxidoreductase [Nitrososphaera sp.]